MKIFFETVCEISVFGSLASDSLFECKGLSTRGEVYICPLTDNGMSYEEGVLAIVCYGLVDNHIAQLSSTNTNTD